MNIISANKTLMLLKRLFDSEKPTESMLPYAPQKPRCTAAPVSSALPRARRAPVEAAAFIREAISDPDIHVHNIMIVRDGTVLAEHFEAPNRAEIWKSTFSACKSITSLAVGMLIGEGLLSLDERVADIFADRLPPLAGFRLRDLTLRMLLTMTSGAVFNEAEAMVTQDWVRGFLNSSVRGEQGRDFSYNSLNTYMLSAAVTAKTGLTLSEYLEPRLFGPLGISEYYWEKCPAGIDKGGWGLYIKTEDLAKIGMLVMNGGKWNGVQLVPSGYIAEATRTQAIAPKGYGRYDYGYQIWVGRKTDSFLFNGMLGQNLLGYRRNGVIIAVNAGNGDVFQQNAFFALADRYFGVELSGKTCRIKRAREKRARLPVQCRRLSGRSLVPCDATAAAVGLMPVMLQATQNCYSEGVSGLKFSLSGKKFFVDFSEKGGSRRFALGFGRWEYSDVDFGGEVWTVAASGQFTHDEDGVSVLKMRVCFVETPCERIIKLFFTANGVRAELSETPCAEFLKKSVSSFGSELANRRIIGTVFSKLDREVIGVKLDRTLSPVFMMR